MSEYFNVNPAEVFGMGALAEHLTESMTKVDQLVVEAQPGEGYTGAMMMALKPAISEYATGTATRLTSRHRTVTHMGYSLRQAGWRYTAADRSHAEDLVKQHSRLSQTEVCTPTDDNRLQVDDLTGAASYPVGEIPDLTAPPHRQADIKGLIDQTSGLLVDIDEGIRKVTDIVLDDPWSPLSEVVKPLSGNWTELERAGEVFSKCGTATETIGGSLKSGAERVDKAWDGSAAVAFQSYQEGLVKALEWEGPMGRIADRVLQATSKQIQDTAKEVLQKINDFVENRIVKKGLKDALIGLVASATPGSWLVTIEKAFELGKTLYDFVMEIKKVIDKINQLITDAKSVIDALKNPADFAQKKIEDKLKPIKDKIDKAEDRAQFVSDLAGVADMNALNGAPKTEYTSPAGPAAYEDAK